MIIAGWVSTMIEESSVLGYRKRQRHELWSGFPSYLWDGHPVYNRDASAKRISDL
jgi:hypothetical protein